jgi:hypothetical protein
MRHTAARWFTVIAAMLALSFVAGSAFAQDDDPPNRAARLSYASGSVSFEPAGTDEWVEAIVNRPMTTGDKLWADQDGRVEVRIDSYALRLGPQTGFSFLNLDDNVVQVRLTGGSLNVRVRRLDENQTLEIDTPNLAFNVLRPGSYRIDVNENGDATLVTVRDGQGEVTGGGSAYPIRAGESANFSGVDQLNADVEGIGDGDDFDQWSNSRDQRWEHSASARYVSDDAVGYEDLDENGQWDSDPEYGTVWYPRSVAADWAPYRYGHWVWVSPWGWTWVDDASWGFAPFHYGRWVVARGRWCWVPSPPRPAYVTREYVRPVYAPALVAWVGGPRFGVGVAVGGAAAGVAWFPLGPRDVYTPSYHVSERYVERVNVSNTTIVNRTQVTNVYNNVYVNNTKNVSVTNITYQNQRANNAVTATSQASFTTAQPVGRNQVRVDAREVASAPVAARTTVAPQARSFTGTAAPAKARPPATLASRNVVAKTAPPPPPAPVAQQVKAVEANGGRPVAVTQVRANQPQPASANVKVAAPAKAAALPPKGNSVNRPGQPGRPAQATQQSQPAPAQPNTAQPNANRPANVSPNTPNAGNPNQPNPNQPNANRPNANAPNATANRPNPSQPNANPPNANRPNANRPNAPNAENPNRPAPNQPNANPNAPNANRPNAENPNRPNANPPATNPPDANRPNANPNSPNAENPNRPNPNRPPTATPNNPNANNPNANRPADNRPATNDRPPAARQNPEPQTQQRQQQQADQLRQQQQQERQNAEQQRAQQQQRLEQQRADEQKRQDVQRQQQQQQQKEAAKPQPKEQQPPPREAAKPQPKEQQPPPKKDNKDNKDNKEKDKKDRPPSR